MTHSDKPLFETSVVWRQGEMEVMNYMVFGLSVSARGTLLSFTEARIHFGDDSPHHLALKRSKDGGRTWGGTQFIEQSLNGECWANPAALVDRETSRLFIFYALNERNLSTRVFFKVSDDDGLTWSSRREITPLLQQANSAKWTVFMPGPGHGIQLSDGRLMLQLWGRKEITLGVGERRYGNRVIYSDDHGETWQMGGIVPLDPKLSNNESRVVEMTDGTLLLNARSKGYSHRVLSVSRDRGLTWSHPVYDMQLPAQWGCDCGLVKWAGSQEWNTTSWLYSTITKRRQDLDNTLSVVLSHDEGQSWPQSKVVHRGPCNYSDLAVMPDNTVAVLFGSGAFHLAPSFAEDVSFVRFNAKWFNEQAAASGE